MRTYDMFIYLITILRKILEFVGLVTVIYLLRNFTNFLFKNRDLSRIERTYSESLKYMKRNMPGSYYILSKLPDEIIIETTYRGERIISSRFRTTIKKLFKRIFKKKYIDIIIFSDMSYPEQLAFIIKKTFEMGLRYEKVLEKDFRDSLVAYYSYKFALTSKDIVEKDTLDILESDFQRCQYKEVILNLDSKELEETITLNPPPEVAPLLDRVIIPLLDFKNKEMMSINELSVIESVKIKMRELLTNIGKGNIAILFIGKKMPEEYLSYIKDKIASFKGLLVCSRGTYVSVYREFLHNEIKELLKSVFNTNDIVEEYFEGYIRLEGDDKDVYYKMVLFLIKT